MKRFAAFVTRARATVFIIVVAATWSGCAGPEKTKKADPRVTQQQDPEPQETTSPGILYEVKSGDTLFGIAKAHGLSETEIAEVNGLDDPNHLIVGQVLFIPNDEMGDRNAAIDIRREPTLQSPTVKDVTSTSEGFAWPIAGGVLLREFNPVGASGMDGIMMAAPAGTDVVASKDGQVAFAGEGNNALGALVIIQHEGQTVSIYGHLENITVRKGQQVVQGTVIGKVGRSGRAESPQLHFQVRKERAATDPLALLPPP